VSPHVFVGDNNKDDTNPSAEDDLEGKDDMRRPPVASTEVEQKGVLKEWMHHGGELTRWGIVQVDTDLQSQDRGS
jgi:hypothetical protein